MAFLLQTNTLGVVGSRHRGGGALSLLLLLRRLLVLLLLLFLGTRRLVDVVIVVVVVHHNGHSLLSSKNARRLGGVDNVKVPNLHRRFERPNCGKRASGNSRRRRVAGWRSPGISTRRCPNKVAAQWRCGQQKVVVNVNIWRSTAVAGLEHAHVAVRRVVVVCNRDENDVRWLQLQCIAVLVVVTVVVVVVAFVTQRAVKRAKHGISARHRERAGGNFVVLESVVGNLETSNV
mmetsp:Transcript_11561/g.30614  ORF Transcript_11561/g.30614 Transcript_11561/m.30614 type:complete len:233 (-) Transcript_11561:60-758(-)